MKLLKLDKKFAVEYFRGKEFQTVKNFRVYSCDFGYVIQTEKNDFILTSQRGVLTFTEAKK